MQYKEDTTSDQQFPEITNNEVKKVIEKWGPYKYELDDGKSQNELIILGT